MVSKKIFLDSSVLYAFIDRADVNHTKAVKILEYLSFQGIHLYTSVQVTHDTYTAVTQQLGTALGFDFLQALLESNVEILYPQKGDLISAFKLLRANRDKQISLKEAINATLMQKRSITQILIFTYWHNLLGSQTYAARSF